MPWPSRIRRVRWLARLAGLASCGLWLVVLGVALDEGLTPRAIPATALMALTIAAFGLAWRRERAGALAMMLCSLALSAAFMISTALAGDPPILRLIAVLPGLPTLIAGALLHACARRPPQLA